MSNAHRLGYKPKYSHIEVEQRFLLGELPSDIDLSSFVRIEDFYITDTNCRLRRMTHSDGTRTDLKLTQKFFEENSSQRNRIITTMYLTENEFEIFYSQLSGTLLLKHRHKYIFGGMCFSIDVFQEQLAGLMLCEIESNEVVPIPAFTTHEVTDDIRFTGGELVNTSRAALEKLLSSYSP